MKKNIIIVILFLSFFILLPNYKNKAYHHHRHLDSNYTILNSLEHDINNDSMSDNLLITTDNNFLYLNINDMAYTLPYIDYESMKTSMSTVPQLCIWHQKDQDILLIKYELDKVLGNPLTFILYYNTTKKDVCTLIDFSEINLEYTLNPINKNTYLYTILPYNLSEVVSFNTEMNTRYLNGNIKSSGDISYGYCEFIEFEDIDNDGYNEIIEQRYPIKMGWPLKEPSFKIIHDTNDEGIVSQSQIFEISK